VKQTPLGRTRFNRKRCTWKTQKVFRAEVIRRAEGYCQRCREPFPDYMLDAHHMIPRGRGGTDDPENGRALCNGPAGCHMLVEDHNVPDWRDWIKRRPNPVEEAIR
jgi:hypothetical protein